MIPKVYPILYTPQFQVIGWRGESEMIYFWKEKIEYEEFPGINIHAIIDRYTDFVRGNRRKLTIGTVAVFLDSPFNTIRAVIKRIMKRGEGYKYRRMR